MYVIYIIFKGQNYINKERFKGQNVPATTVIA